MKSYAERQIFSSQELLAWRAAVACVEKLAPTWGNELRCHELVRAVQRVLDERWRESSVVDGQLWMIEHSWLVLDTPGPPLYRELNRFVILDVYCPGRMPQVQLIDSHFVVVKGYKPGEPRTDIDAAIVDKLVREMRQ